MKMIGCLVGCSYGLFYFEKAQQCWDLWESGVALVSIGLVFKKLARQDSESDTK